MRRREFIALFGGTVIACPLAARAQQTATPVVGFLSAVSPSNGRSWVDGFREGLGIWFFIF
jgi:putative ABC transport system substrate-binding protein